MNTPSTEAAGSAAAASERGQIFFASCVALVATSMIFSVRADILGAWEHYFRSSSEAIGFAILPAFWGFTIAIFIGGQLCDLIGMRALLGLAFLAHVAGTILTIFAPTVGILGLATLIIGLGNGFVEAGINPLVATIYPDQKTVKLNILHAWWPGGQIIGGLAAFFLTLLFVQMMGLNDPSEVVKYGHIWKVKQAIVLIPMLIYGFLFLKLRLPPTERVQSGVSTAEMYREMFRPLFLVFLFGMLLSAATELGTVQWISEIMNEIALKNGILVLVWINIIMLVGRLFAGPMVHRFNPVGLLIGSAFLSAVGLLAMARVTGPASAFGASFIFALGICYFWPTMLGITSERFPKGGAVLLGLMGAAGMASAGVAQPWLGALKDNLGASGALTRVAILPIILFVIYVIVYLSDRARGGYRVERLSAGQ